VIGHQAECVDAAVERLHRSLQKGVETGAVAISEEYRLAGVAAQDDVINGAGLMDAGFAWHGERGVANIRKSSLTPEVQIRDNKGGRLAA
jgi:hypothetical protein